MKKKEVKTIIITMEFGSGFQKEVGLQIIKTMLEAFKVQMASTHKGNKVEIKSGGDIST